MIYFDNAATTFSHDFVNPSSPHGLGFHAERALSNARGVFADILNCRKEQIIFTSGGTESNNLALIGFALAYRRQSLGIFAEPWEHPSVLEPIRFVKEQGYASAYISPFSETLPGPLLSFPEALSKKHEIQLISISHVCHETGCINDVVALAKSIKRGNPAAVVHVDGTQGFCKEPIDLTDIDMYSFSAHKCHGPSGVGGLVAKVRILPLMYGGGQENGLRPGTENVAGISAFADTAKALHHSIDANRRDAAEIKNVLKSIINELPDVFVNERGNAVSPYILNMSFLGINGETLIHLLSDNGLCASMGAACNSRKKAKPPLELMGFDHARALSAVRFSFSFLNTLEEAKAAKGIIINCVKQLRKMVGR
ncbi:MAG: aminotransferase class V-fold PLP-dependent enzyme [Defluviitaleaceae bacterium]|nr:aminotransferase class V-fold PLP-dependent enzyme [Defluviitaleaceae bacterium]